MTDVLDKINEALTKPISDELRTKLQVAKLKIEHANVEEVAVSKPASWSVVNGGKFIGLRGGKTPWYGIVVDTTIVDAKNRSAFIEQLISNINVEKLGIFKKGKEKPLRKSAFKFMRSQIGEGVLLIFDLYETKPTIVKKIALAAKKTAMNFKPGKVSPSATVRIPVKLWKRIMSAMGSGNDKTVVAAWEAAKKFEASQMKKAK